MKFHFRVIYNEILWRPKETASLKARVCEDRIGKNLFTIVLSVSHVFC